MDTINFDWLESDTTIIDSLVASSTVPTNNANGDILQYLLQNDNNNTTISNNFVSAITIQPQPSHMTETPVPAENALPATHKVAATNFRSTVSVVQTKDNFVTFMPIKKSIAPKKAKFKEPIFVTESPQNAYNKKKKKPNNNNAVQLSHSSGEENSDDMLLDEELTSSTSPSKLKHMTSKERRQLRNKISARNFRVRRKEYITQLEEKVEEHEKTIEGLKEENSKLLKANDEIMKQLLNQPITPPYSSSSDELFSNSSSGSEGHHSPEAAPIPPILQFQLNDLYDFSLFDQQQQQQQQRTMSDVNNLFYLNHAIMPDWDIHQVLGEKGRPVATEEAQQQVSRELLSDYPLLAPALMSIILRHTLSLEYVTSLAKEFSEHIGSDLTTEKATIENTGVKTKTLKIELSKETGKKNEEEKLTDEAIMEYMLLNYFPTYVFMRASGMSHEKLIAKCRECMENKNTKCKVKQAKKDARKKEKAEQVKSNQKKLLTLQAYCRVAGTLLKHPQRMSHVNKVLKEEIGFTHNKHTARIESNYASIMAPMKNLCITGSSK